MPLPDQDVRTECDEDLLVYMSWRSDEPELAQAACGEFYERHKAYLFAVILRSHGKSLGREGVSDMTTETFMRVFERAETYKPSGSSDVDVQRRNVLAWVGAIANNLCLDHFRHPDTRLVLVDEWADDTEPTHREEVEECFHLSDELRLIHEAMDTLTAREQEVLRVTMAYWKTDGSQQRLPNDVAEDLARSWETTSANIRKIRERAMKKVREFVEAAQQDRRGGRP